MNMNSNKPITAKDVAEQETLVRDLQMRINNGWPMPEWERKVFLPTQEKRLEEMRAQLNQSPEKDSG
jgi:hypothetical protein